MNNRKVSAHVHRFHAYAALAFVGVDGETVYLAAADADALGDALKQCAADIRAHGFVASPFRTVELPLTNNGSRYS